MADTKITKILDIQVKYKEAVQAMMEYSRASETAKKRMAELKDMFKTGTISEEEYHRQLQTTKVALTETNDKLRRVAKEMQNNVRQEQYLKGSLAGLRAELSNLTKQYDELSRAERESAKGDELQKKINKVTKEIKDAEAATQRFYRNVGNYPQAMAQAGTAMNGFISTIPGLNGLGAAVSGVTSAIGGMVQGIAGAAGKFGVFGAAVTGTIAVVGALGAAFTSGAKTAMDFNSAVSGLAAVQGTNADGVKRLTDLAREYGATTKYTATEVVQLQTELAKLGYAQEDIGNMTGSVLSLAQATGVSLAEAASLTGATLRMFEDDTTHTTEYVDKMAKACTASALDFGYLQTAMSTVGPVANAFGFNIEDVLSLLGQLANAGFDASSAATATRNILLNLADANGDLAKQLGKPVTSLKELTAGLSQLDENGINLAESLALTDKRSVAAFNTFLKTAGAAEELQEKLLNADGAAKQMADTMADNLEGDVATLNSAWQEFTLLLNGTQEPMRSIVQWLTKVVRSAGEAYGNLKSYFADLYNNSMAFRSIVQGITLSFNISVDAIKTSFTTLGDIVLGFGKALKGAFTLDWDSFSEGMEQMTTATAKNMKEHVKEMVNDIKNAYKETVSGSIETEESSAESSGSSSSPSSSSGGKVNAGMGFKNDKQRKAEEAANKAQAKADLEAQKAYEDSLVALIQDANEKRKKALEQRYKNEIDKLRLKLDTEKNLTQEARDNLTKAIENKEKERDIELAKLDAEIAAEAIKRKEQEIALQLAAVRKGADEEYGLRLQQLELQQQAELAAAEKSLTNKEDLERRKVLIAAKYAFEEEQLAAERDRKIAENERQAMENRFTEAAMLAEQNAVEAAQIEVDRRLYEKENLHRLEEETDEQFHARELAAQKAYNDAKKKLTDQENAVTQGRLQVAASVNKGLIGIMEAFGEQNKALLKMSKVFALAEIGINTGKAIAAGVAQAQSVPFPANLAAVATTVATVLSNIATAISTVKEAHFAKGVINLQGPGTSTSDSIPARLSKGESVMTAKATKEFGGLLAIMNKVATQPNYTPPTTYENAGSIEFEGSRVSAMRNAMEEIRPVVSVEEINRVSNQVSVIESLDTL